MLEEQQDIVDALLLTLDDERALERESVRIRNAAETANLEWVHVRMGPERLLRPHLQIVSVGPAPGGAQKRAVRRWFRPSSRECA